MGCKAGLRGLMSLTTNKRVVSVVDDDESIRKAITRMGHAAGLEVEAFGSAEEFLDEGNTADSACLILDINLPGISGIDLQDRLNKSSSSIPIIFISAYGDDRTRENAFGAGAVQFLEKPFTMRTLVAAIRSAI